jgi:hypothetical protein
MRVRRIVAVVVAASAIGVVAVAWSQEEPALTASEAAGAAESALRHAGLDPEVDADPVASTYDSRAGEPVDVWAVHATVRSELIELQLARAGALLVAMDDRASDGASYVLSDREFENVAANVDDPVRPQQLQRNIALTIGAALVVALSLAHAAASHRSPARKEP